MEIEKRIEALERENERLEWVVIDGEPTPEQQSVIDGAINEVRINAPDGGRMFTLCWVRR